MFSIIDLCVIDRYYSFKHTHTLTKISEIKIERYQLLAIFTLLYSVKCIHATIYFENRFYLIWFNSKTKKKKTKKKKKKAKSNHFRSSVGSYRCVNGNSLADDATTEDARILTLSEFPTPTNDLK